MSARIFSWLRSIQAGRAFDGRAARIIKSIWLAGVPVVSHGLSGFQEQGGEGAIKMVLDRHITFGEYKAQLRHFTVNIRDDAFVLLGFNAARTVDQATAGFQEWYYRFDDSPLNLVHSRKILWGKSPTNVCAPADDPGVCAGSIHQDRVESFKPKRGAVLKPIQ
jgi:hypothetical protein